MISCKSVLTNDGFFHESMISRNHTTQIETNPSTDSLDNEVPSKPKFLYWMKWKNLRESFFFQFFENASDPFLSDSPQSAPQQRSHLLFPPPQTHPRIQMQLQSPLKCSRVGLKKYTGRLNSNPTRLLIRLIISIQIQPRN